jgi:PPOX class probable FMN-dependent enzyme
MDSSFEIRNAQELEAIIGEPIDFIKLKIVDALDETMLDFIRRSPLVFISTLDADGRPDISPKGDPNGFTQIDDSGNLILPERPGNKLTFGFRNILANDRIGLIYVIPGVRETLRVKGRATLHRDPDVLESLSVNGRPALMYTHVKVEECFFHCGKAMIRSKLWKPESWEGVEDSGMVRQFVQKMAGAADAELEKVIGAEIEKNYDEELY